MKKIFFNFIKLTMFVMFVFLFLVEDLITTLPELELKMEQVQALSKRAPPGGITENIWAVKDLIQESRNYVHRVMSIFFSQFFI